MKGQLVSRSDGFDVGPVVRGRVVKLALVVKGLAALRGAGAVVVQRGCAGFSPAKLKLGPHLGAHVGVNTHHTTKITLDMAARRAFH